MTEITPEDLDFGAAASTSDNHRKGMNRHFPELLEKSILGQPAVCDALGQFLTIRNVWQMGGDTDRNVPPCFVFVGPEGAGKNHVAELFSRIDGEGDAIRPVKVVSMATYQNDNEAAGLVGLRSMYSTARPGELTSFVRENPSAVLVFEDFDSAHPNVQDILAPMLSKGELVDQCGFFYGDPKQGNQIAPPEVDFSETIIIFTTTLGKETYNDQSWLDRVGNNPTMLKSILVQEFAGQPSSFDDDLPAVGRRLLAELAKQEWILFRRLDMPALLQIAERGFSTLESGGDRAGVPRLVVHSTDREHLLTALILASGPEPKPSMLGTQDLLRRLLPPAFKYSEAGKQKLLLQFSPMARQHLKASLELLGDDPLRNLFRKNLMLALSARAGTQTEDATTIILEGCELKKVPRQQDYSGHGALVVDLPEQRFSDISGHAQAKTRMREVINMLRQPQSLSEWKVEPPRGMLLMGPPGTGKTMLARAFAHEADLPFIATTGTEMQNPAIVALTFRRARDYAPAAVFIDEIDAIGRRDGRGAIEAINQLLAEIDGFRNDSRHRIFVIAATNLPDQIDPAIVRAGRIDLHIHIPALDSEARRYFVKRLKPLACPNDTIDWEKLVGLSAGMTGADLEKLRRETAYDLMRRQRPHASQEDLVEHINIIKYGIRDQRERTQEEMEHVAYHEAGHALLSRLLNPEVTIRQITIDGRGMTEGFVEFDAESRRDRRTRKEIKEELVVLLGGRQAQVLKFGEVGIDPGASSDLARATQLAFRAIAEWGMDDEIGPVSIAALYGETSRLATYRAGCIEQYLLPQSIDQRVAHWIREAEATAMQLLTRNLAGLEMLAHELLEGSAQID